MKVWLIYPSSLEDAPSMERAERRCAPSLAAISLGFCLKEKGIECDITDTLIDKVDIGKIRDEEYGLISITVLIGNFLKNARDLSTLIKKTRPDIHIVFGGVMASIFPDLVLKEYSIDFMIRYDDENSLSDLVEYLQGKRQISEINGFSYKSGDRIIHNSPRYLEKDLDAFPVPDGSLLGPKCNTVSIPTGAGDSK